MEIDLLFKWVHSFDRMIITYKKGRITGLIEKSRSGMLLIAGNHKDWVAVFCQDIQVAGLSLRKKRKRQ